MLNERAEGASGNAVGKAAACVKAAVSLARDGGISWREAILSVDPASLPGLLHPRVDPEAGAKVLISGAASSPGAISGEIVLDPQKVRESQKPAVLVTESVGPDDKNGILSAAAVVAAPGGLGSHDLLMLRGAGIPTVGECEGLAVDVESGVLQLGGEEFRAGVSVTVDGSSGAVFLGEVPVLGPEAGGDLDELLARADEERRHSGRSLSVRANVSAPEDARRARDFGAEGVGLCRTERMLMRDEGCLAALRRLVLARSAGEEQAALSELEEGQREDFEGLFRAMSGLPVAVRLLDPPLHEFLPDAGELRERLAEDGDHSELRRTLEAVEATEEANPMLGTRGTRLGLSRPGIYRMQVRALVAAVEKVREEGYEPNAEILVPLVQIPEELRQIKDILHEELGDEDVPIGPTVEAPRACAVAGALAREAPFLSFGTNDLTQTAFGISRDDARGGFLTEYLERGILGTDPFEVIDEEGVGRLMALARDLGREANPDLKLSVCGEHGGEPESIRFFHSLGFDYVSCSPFRVPVARLAAAQAALRKEPETTG